MKSLYAQESVSAHASLLLCLCFRKNLHPLTGNGASPWHQEQALCLAALACHWCHQPSPQRMSHHIHRRGGQVGNPTALPPLGAPTRGAMSAQPREIWKEEAVSGKDSALWPEGSCSPRWTSKAAAPHCSPSEGKELHTQTWLSADSPALRAALWCWDKVAGTFRRAELQALAPEGSGNGAVAPPPWGPSEPCAAEAPDSSSLCT